jgi:hypothetical protein
MAWNLNRQDLEEMKLNNPRLYQQISDKYEFPENYKDSKQNKITNEQENTLSEVEYSYQWASKHILLAIIINFIIKLFGYDYKK